MNDIDLEDLLRDKRRATSVAMKLVRLLRKDHSLFSKIDKRSLRWIAKQEQLELDRLDQQDKKTRLIARRKQALSKLSNKERKLLGLPTDEEIK